MGSKNINFVHLSFLLLIVSLGDCSPNQTESISDPTEPFSDPTESSSDPTESFSDPSESFSDPTESFSDPTESSSDHTESSSDHTESSVDHTESPNKDKQSFMPLIINGTKTTITKFPYIAYIFAEKKGHACGGTIVSERVVMTSAHCHQEQSLDPKEMIVIVGATNVAEAIKSRKDSEIYKICNFKVHEDYDTSKEERRVNDIALMFTDRRIKQSKIVKVARLPLDLSFMRDFRDKRFAAVGWGKTKSRRGKITAGELMKTRLTLMDLKWCYEFHGSPLTYKFCLMQDGTGVCNGDLGVTYRNMVVGIFSYGGVSKNKTGRCQTKVPQVFTSLLPFKRWIKKTVIELSNKCKKTPK